MRFKRSLLTTVVLTVALGSQTVSGAQSVTVRNGVTVIRGNSEPTTVEGRRVTRERAGVTVFRGSAAPFAPEQPTSDETTRRILKGGENLWIYNPETGKVTACNLRQTIYGDQAVRCASN